MGSVKTPTEKPRPHPVLPLNGGVRPETARPPWLGGWAPPLDENCARRPVATLGFAPPQPGRGGLAEESGGSCLGESGFCMEGFLLDDS